MPFVKEYRLENARSGKVKLQLNFLPPKGESGESNGASSPRGLKSLSNSIRRSVSLTDAILLGATPVEFGGVIEAGAMSPGGHTRKASTAGHSVVSVSSQLSMNEACEFSGEGKITIVEARNLKSVDKNGLSDPYVKVSQTYHGKQRTVFKSDVVKKNLSPVWSKGNEFRFKAPPGNLVFTVKDKDARFLFGSSDSGKDMGEVSVNMFEMFEESEYEGKERPFVIEKGFDKWFKLELGGDGEVRIKGELKFTFK